MNIAGKGKVVAYTTFISLLINGMLNFMFIPYFFNLYGEGGSGVGASLTTNISELSVFIGFIFVMGIKKFGYTNLLRVIVILGVFIGSHYVYEDINQLSLFYKIPVAIITLPVLSVLLGCFQYGDLKVLKDRGLRRG